MKNRIALALAVIALNFGILSLASAAPAAPDSCASFCAIVRCPYWAPTCGKYIDPSGQVACGCH